MIIEVAVSCGELLDKMTILEIKNIRITDPAKLLNVAKELSILKSKYIEILKNIQHETVERLKSLVQELIEVNTKLWDIEDLIRTYEANKQFDEKFISTARSVYYNNDQRFMIKQKINALLNSGISEEKSHPEYNNA